MRYISRAERESMILVDVLTAELHNRVIPQTAKMPSDIAKRFKSATTNLIKAFKGYYDTLSADDQMRLRKESSQSNVIITSRAYQPKDRTDEQLQTVWTLAEFAIGQNCKGCTKDGEKCALKHALAMADVPYSTTEPVNCPYELSAEVNE